MVSTLSKLVDLCSDGTGDHSSCGGNGWNDLTSDHFSLLSIAILDLIVSRSQIGTVIDEINMEVCIIVFFEFRRLEIVFLDFSFQCLEVFNKLLNYFVVIFTCWLWLSLLIVVAAFFFSWEFDDNFLGDVLWHGHSLDYVSDLASISVFWNL